MCDILIENSRKMRNTIINHLEGMVIRLKRNAIQDLINWKSREDRKPMVLKGARQVGKTWLPTLFAKSRIALYKAFEEGDAVASLTENNTVEDNSGKQKM